MLRSPLPQNPAQLPYNQREVQQKCCQTTLQSFGLLGKEQRKTCEEQSLQQWQEQKRDKTVIINLTVALLEVCRVFFYSNGNCWLYLHYLNFFIPLVMFSFIKTHIRLPAALAQGLSFYISHMQLQTAMETIPGPIGRPFFFKNNFLLGPPLFLFLNILMCGRNFYKK